MSSINIKVLCSRTDTVRPYIKGGFYLATHNSAIKRARQNEKRRLRNKMNKTRIKSVTKSARAALDESPDKAQEALKEAMRVIDRAAGKGALHRRTASRKIARLSRQVFKSQAGEQA